MKFLNIFPKRTLYEEIFIGFRSEIGIVDLQGIEEYISQRKVENIYLLAYKDLNEKVRDYLEKKIKPKQEVEFILTDSFQKEIKKIKVSHKGKRIRVQDMEEFGQRAMSRDVC
ncbi:MAG: hypothetical protein DRP50_09010 [Thermotoga sp.]|nr:hypothetical protein [Thermotogota bacterium]RKX51349.1 MAG: hypothetical protein DRP50_09010 [Thermotoga sp.]